MHGYRRETHALIVRHYLFHGVRLETRTTSSVLAEALDTRLCFFITEVAGHPDCRLDLQLAPAAELAQIGPPPGIPNQVLLHEGEVHVAYLEATDEMHMAYREGLKAVVHGSEGYAQIFVPEEAIWTIRRLKHAVFMLPLIELLRTRGLYNAHAAGLEIQGKGLLFPADPGSGKTTLTLALARGGFGLLSDDLLFLKQEGEQLALLAFPDDVDVTENTARLFPEIEPYLRPLLPGRLKRQVSMAEAFGTRTVARCVPAAVVCPRIAHTDHTRLESISPVEAFVEFAKSVTLVPPKTAQVHLDLVGQLLREVPCYRMHTGRDLDALPGILQRLVTK